MTVAKISLHCICKTLCWYKSNCKLTHHESIFLTAEWSSRACIHFGYCCCFFLVSFLRLFPIWCTQKIFENNFSICLFLFYCKNFYGFQFAVYNLINRKNTALKLLKVTTKVYCYTLVRPCNYNAIEKIVQYNDSWILASPLPWFIKVRENYQPLSPF